MGSDAPPGFVRPTRGSGRCATGPGEIQVGAQRRVFERFANAPSDGG
jgi:hypothetical protein